MNERIKQLAEQAGITEGVFTRHDGVPCDLKGYSMLPDEMQKFAELIVKECVSTVENLSPGYQDYRNQIEDAFRRDCVEQIKEHFGVTEPRTQPDQEAAKFIAAEDKKVASRYGYVPKLHPSEWKY